MTKEDFPRIVFMGSPNFAVSVLKGLIDNNKNIVGVVTVPDKPCGRGQKIQPSPVKVFAQENNIPILQPENLKDPEFIEVLKNDFKPDIQIVVAFRILPEEVWSIPKMGTFNLHASLLPQYRGAAPINWAIINGEKETGVTTFLINNGIDTGNILLQEKVSIEEHETAGELEEKLKIVGTNLVLKTLEGLINKSISPIKQESLIEDEILLKKAPKIYKNDCKINWSWDVNYIYNFIRGLSPEPTAWCYWISDNEQIMVKIYKAEKIILKHDIPFGTIESDGKKIIRIAALNGYIEIKALQLPGKKILNVEEFLRGFKNINNYKAL